MPVLDNQPTTANYDGTFHSEGTLSVGSTFHSDGDINFGTATGHHRSTVNIRQLNITDSLGQISELETRLTAVERTLEKQQLCSSLTLLRTPHQGFVDWRASLSAFNCSESQRQAAADILNQIDGHLSNITERLANPPANSEDLQANIGDIDEAILELKSLFPGARAEAQNPHQELAQSQYPQDQTRPALTTLVSPVARGPPYRTNSAPPNPDIGAERTSASSFPLPQASTTGGIVYQRINAGGNSFVHAGDFYDLSAAAPGQSLFARRGSGTLYGPIDVKDHARFHAGLTYGNSNSRHPLQN